MIDLSESVRAFAALRKFEGEPRLAHLVPAATALERVAQNIEGGSVERYVPPRTLRIANIPTRELAAQVMQYIDRIPGLHGDESEPLKLAYANLSAAVVFTIMHVIFRDYRDLVPSHAEGAER